MPTRCIVHLDLDAFYASVEEVENPAIKGQPIIVVMGGGEFLDRGAVATASYAARKHGVHSAMAVSQARQTLPDAIYVPVRRGLYSAYSQRVMALLHEFGAILEQVSIDEAYLDLTALVAGWEDGVALAQRMKQTIGDRTGLTASVGVATNKLCAKMASGYQKPAGFTVITPGTERAFLAPMPVDKLHGIGPRFAARLHDLNVRTIGDLAATDPARLRQIFGPNLGDDLYRHACGEDSRILEPDRAYKSFSSEQTYSPAIGDPRFLWRTIQEMAGELSARLLETQLQARTVGVKLVYSDFRIVSRARTSTPTDDPVEIARRAAFLMRHGWQRGRPLRRFGLRIENFADPAADTRQLFLPL